MLNNPALHLQTPFITATVRNDLVPSPMYVLNNPILKTVDNRKAQLLGIGRHNGEALSATPLPNRK